MDSRSRTRARAALVFLLAAAGCLAVVLVTCLPPERQRAPAHAGSGQTGGAPLQPRKDRSTSQPPAALPERPQRTGRLALIIDDAGYSLEDLEPFLRFPGPIAIAVLPHLPYSVEAARRIRAAGKELLLHMPMEPLGGGDAGPGAIRVDQSDAEIESLLSSAFDSVPGARGLNNHMGSRATADERVMNVVLRFLKREGKYFVDSRTTPLSVGAQSAELWDVPFLQRDVFVDNERDDPDIERSIALGASEAGARGQAILIGHVHSPQILAIVRREMESRQDGGLRLAGLQEILGDGKSARR